MVGSQTIDLDGELLALAGTATIDVFGFFTGKFMFAVDTDAVRATVGTGGAVDTLTGAQLTTLSLEVGWSESRSGRPAVSHLVITDGTKLAVAVLKPAAPAVGATFTDTQGVDRCQGDRRRRRRLRGSTGSCCRSRRLVLLQQRVRGA